MLYFAAAISKTRRGGRNLFCKQLFVLFIILFLNYLPIFSQLSLSFRSANAAGSPTIEQQINMLNQEYSIYGNTYGPTDNSLGLVYWDADKYTGETVYFEVVIRALNASSTAYAALYTSAGVVVSGSEVSVGSSSFQRLRSAAVTLTDNTQYSVRIKNNWGTGTTYINAARLVIVQTDASLLTDTETQIEIGANQITTSDSYGLITNPKKYYYDSSRFSPSPTAYFEANIKSQQATIEQQINISDQEYSFTGNTYSPTDNSLGLVYWDADKYNGSTIYFEAVIRNPSASGTAYAALYTSAGAAVSGSEVTVDSDSYARLRSSAITLTDNTQYTVRVKNAWGTATTYVNAARLIVIQSASTGITATSTQIEVGASQNSFTNTSAADLTDYKLYMYNQSQFSPTPEASADVSFSATLKIDNAADTVYAELYNKTDGAVVATVSNTGTTNWTLASTSNVDADTDWDTTNDDEYHVRVYCADGEADGCSGSIANAKIILDQTGVGGITTTELVHTQVNAPATDGDSTYTDQDFLNRFNPDLDTTQASFAGGNFGYFFEATMKTAAGTGYTQLINDTAGSAITDSEVFTNSSSYERKRSAEVTANVPTWPPTIVPPALDTQIKNSGANTTTVSSSGLIIQITNLATSTVTAYAELYNLTDFSSVASSEVTTTSNSWSRQRSGAITLTTGKEYTVRIKTSSSTSVPVRISNARIILDQSAAGGINSIELIHLYNNNLSTDADATYTSKNYLNQFDPANFGGGTFTYYFEATLKTSNAANSAYAQLYNVTDTAAITGGEVSTAGTSFARIRSADVTANMPVSAKTLDIQAKNNSTDTTSVASSWLIIQASNMSNSAPDTPTIDNFNDGAWGTDSTPTLQFDLTDPDEGDIVNFELQIDNTSGFLSPEVTYTEPSGSAVPRSNVTYTPDALSDGQYYWRVKGVDDESTESGWATANGGSVAFGIDTTNPAAPTGLASTSHTVSVWSSDNTVDIEWNAAVDAASGIDGYSYIWNTTADTDPDQTKDIEQDTLTLTSAVLEDGSSHYFHIRSVDSVGYWSTSVHLGPFYIDASAPTGSVSISSGATYTASASVELTISGTGGGCSVTNMMICNDSGYSGCDWEAYTTSKEWTLPGPDGVNTVYAKFRDELNQVSDSYSDTITLDTTNPSNPTDLTSTSHTVEVWSNDNTIDLSWTAGTDATSGIDGYSYIWNTTADTTPDTSKDIEENVITLTSAELANGSSHYFHVRTKDNAGNWSSAEHIGPFYIDTLSPTGSVTIDSGDAYAITTSVALTLSATDTLSTITDMKICNVSDFTGCDWEAYAVSKAWTLTVADGEKTVYAKFRDDGNNESETVTDTIILDTTNPTVPTDLDSSTHTIEVWSGEHFVTTTWTASTDATSGIAGYSYIWDTAADTTPDTTADLGEVATSTDDVEDGLANYLHIRAIDNAGNASGAVHLGPIYIDTGIPEGSITIDSGATYTNLQTVTLTLTYTDVLTSVDEMIVSENGSFTGATWVTASTTYEFTLSANDGGKTVYIKFRDIVDNESPRYQDSIILDTTAPSVPNPVSSSHTESVWSNENSVDIIWVSSTDATSGLAGYSYIWDTTSGTTPNTTQDAGSGAVSVLGTTVANGNSHYFHIRAVDNAGNWSNSGEAGPFYVDTVSPTGSVAIDSGATYANSTTVTLATTATDATSDLYQVIVSESNSFTGASWAAYTATTEFTLESTNGTHTVFVKYKDNAANESSTYSDTIVLDTSLPGVSLTAYTPDPTTDSTPTLTGTATESSTALSAVEYQVDSTTGSFTACNAIDGVFDEASETFSCTISTLTDGSHVIYVRALDAGSNISDLASDTLYVDTADPEEFTLTAPSAGVYINDTRPAFTWRAAATPDSGSGLDYYTLYIDNGTSGSFSITTIPASGTGTTATNKYSIAYENFSDSNSSNNYITVDLRESGDWSAAENNGEVKVGERTYKVTAYDKAGNSKQMSSNFYLDTAKPTLSFKINGEPVEANNTYDIRINTFTLEGTITDPEEGSRSNPKKVSLALYKEGLLSDTLVQSIDFSELQVVNGSASFSREFTDLDSGNYYMNVTGEDNAGNTGSSRLDINLVQESSPSLPIVPTQLSEPESSSEEESTSQPEQTVPAEKPVLVEPEAEQEPGFSFQIPLRQGFASAQNVFLGIINTVGNAFGSLAEAIGNTTQSLAGFFGSTANLVAKPVKYLVNASPKVIQRSILAIQQGLRLNIESLELFANKIGEPFEGMTHNVKAGLSLFAVSVFSKEPTKIIGVEVTNVTSTTAEIRFTSNHYVTAKVNYGLSTNYTKEVFVDTRDLEHRVVLDGLEPGKKYYFEIIANGKNVAVDAYRTFETAK